MTVSFAVICLFIGIWQTRGYTELKNGCTSEITGIVADTHHDNSRDAHIRIDSEGESSPFRSKELYVDIRRADEGDRVIIHYSPEQRDTYYISDIENISILHISSALKAPKSNGIFAYGTSGFMLLLSLFLIFVIHRQMHPEH